MPTYYYVWVETVIQYYDTSGMIQTFIEGDIPQKKYIRESIDPDFIPPRTLDTEIREYDRRVLFEGGRWYCLNAGKLRVQGICYRQKIPVDSVVYVFKFKNGYIY